MAQNPYVNKVVYGNDTLLDLTEDSVTENTLLEGETAHSASGAPVTGTAKQGHVIWNAIKTALTQRTKLWFADAKVTDDSTEQATKVEVVQLIDDESELTNAPDGVYQGDYDDAPEDILDASMVAYKDGSVEDALDVESGEILPVANVTQMGSKKRVIKSGHNYYINAVILVLSGASIAANATIATLPYNLHGCYIIGRLDSDGSLLLLTADDNKLIYQFGTIPSGSVIRIGSTVMME